MKSMEAPPFLSSQTPCVLSCKGDNVCGDELYQKVEATKVKRGTDCAAVMRRWRNNHMPAVRLNLQESGVEAGRLGFTQLMQETGDNIYIRHL